MLQAELKFDGVTFDPIKDARRLGAQLCAVNSLMSDGEWRTLGEIAAHVGASEASVSARLRDLRKIKFGEHTVYRRARGERTKGLFEYRVEGRP